MSKISVGGLRIGYNIGPGRQIATETSGLELDFLRNRATVKWASGGTNYDGVPFAADGGQVQFSRGTLATVTDSDGKIKWAPHNLVLNSAAPVTQSITTIVGAKYKVEMTGSGSVALSGAGSGTVTTGVPVEITASTTTLTLTCSGTVSTMWAYRSDLGGMQFNGAGTTYNATTGSAYHGPRLDYDPVTLACKGLLVEEARTNLVTYSEDFSQTSVWNGQLIASVTNNAAIAPSGAMTADLIVPNTTLGQHRIDRSTTIPATAHTWSCFAKAAGYSFVWLRIGSIGAVCNLTTGEISGLSAGVTANAQFVGNGWWRVAVSATAAANDMVRINVATSGGADFAGDGTSGVYLWGAQLEAGSFATSYIPTSSSTVTRNADVASVGVSQFPYSATEGTLVAFYQPVYDSSGTYRTQVILRNAGGTNYSSLRAVNTGSNMLANNIVAEATNQVDLSSAAVVSPPSLDGRTTFLIKTALAIKTNDFATSTNGGTVGTDTLGSAPTGVDTLEFKGGQHNCGASWIKQITYIPRRLTNAELQSRTA